MDGSCPTLSRLHLLPESWTVHQVPLVGPGLGRWWGMGIYGVLGLWSDSRWVGKGVGRRGEGGPETVSLHLGPTRFKTQTGM